MANYDIPQYPAKRLRYFNNQFLKDQDFIDDDSAQIGHERAFLRSLCVAGVCEGMVVTYPAPNKPPSVSAGVAVDKTGRMIVIDQPTDGLANPSALPDGDCFVHISFLESEDDKATGQGAPDYTRWRQTPAISMTAKAAALPDGAVVLASCTVAGGVFVGAGSTVGRQYSGLRLPGPNKDVTAALRNTGAADDLAVLTGSLTVRRDAVGQLGPTLTLLNGLGGAGAGASIDFDGYDPGTNDPALRVRSIDDGNFSSHLAFSTKQAGANTNKLVERLRLTSDGLLRFSNDAPKDKIVIYDNGATDRYGIGLNSGNINLFCPTGAHFSLRQNNSSGTEVFSITGAGGDIQLSGKHAFRGSDPWLRLNQDGAFPNGVHTPGNFLPNSLNVGGANGWATNPGPGNAWVAGTLQVFGGAIVPKVGNDGGSGIQFPVNPGGGGGDEAFLRYSVQTGETTKLILGINNDPDDALVLWQAGAARLTIASGLVRATSTFIVDGDIQLSSKHAFRGNDSWLRLNQDGHFASGVYTPGVLRADGDLQLSGKTAIRGNDGWLRLNQDGHFGAGVYIPGVIRVDGDVQLSGKHAFRGNDSWLRLNQDGAFPSGVHTPRKLAPGSLLVGPTGPLGWDTDPGSGNILAAGEIEAHGAWLKVTGTGDERGYVGGDGAGADVQIGSTKAGIMTVAAWNWVSGWMDVAGRNWLGHSDARSKENIEPIVGALEKLLRLRCVSFDWKGDDSGAARSKSLGFVAQEVREVIPEAVVELRGGSLSVAYNSMTALLVEAVKEQQVQIDKLRIALQRTSEGLKKEQ